MSHYYEHQTRRTAEYTARNLLKDQGYDVVRVTERNGALPILFHLIAWDLKRRILFIRIGSSRMKRTVFRNEIQRLSSRVKTGRYPGEVQFWVCGKECWKRYLILPGGAVLLTEVLT